LKASGEADSKRRPCSNEDCDGDSFVGSPYGTLCRPCFVKRGNAAEGGNKKAKAQ
jgi:hypothetical protein